MQLEKESCLVMICLLVDPSFSSEHSAERTIIDYSDKQSEFEK